MLHYCLHCMASVFKKENSPYWYAAFRDHLDMRAQRSTKQVVHAKAVASSEPVGARGQQRPAGHAH